MGFQLRNVTRSQDAGAQLDHSRQVFTRQGRDGTPHARGGSRHIVEIHHIVHHLAFLLESVRQEESALGRPIRSVSGEGSAESALPHAGQHMLEQRLGEALEALTAPGKIDPTIALERGVTDGSAVRDRAKSGIGIKIGASAPSANLVHRRRLEFRQFRGGLVVNAHLGDIVCWLQGPDRHGKSPDPPPWGKSSSLNSPNHPGKV